MTEHDTEARPGSAEGRSSSGRRVAPDRCQPARRQQLRRQQVRRRRSAVLAGLLLLGGTAVARALEDPSDIGAPAAARVAADRATGSAGAASTSANGAAARDSARTSATTGASSPTPGPATSAPASTSAGSPAEDDGGGTAAADTATQPVPAAGTGLVAPMAVPTGPVAATGRPVRYSVEVEGGLPVSSAEFAQTVTTVLGDPRGWQTKDGVRFLPVSPQQLAAGAAVDIRVTLASPSLTAKLCAPLNVTIQQVSCWNGSRSVLNLTRWMHGAVTYGSDLARYRVYLISHEVGHGLGHGHVSCPASGQPAPVMVQQTKSLEGCTASPWPTGT